MPGCVSGHNPPRILHFYEKRVIKRYVFFERNSQKLYKGLLCPFHRSSFFIGEIHVETNRPQGNLRSQYLQEIRQGCAWHRRSLSDRSNSIHRDCSQPESHCRTRYRSKDLARILFFQPTQLKHPLQYWHALQIMERLWWLDRKFFKEAIAAGEQVYEKFTLSIPCRENLAELFQESRAAALREHLDPIIQTKIHREFLADSALRQKISVSPVGRMEGRCAQLLLYCKFR